MMQLNVERVVLEKLLHNAAAASRLIGHLDDNVGGAALGPIADRVDEVVHTLSELLGDPEVVVASVPDGSVVFPDGPDDAREADALLSFELTVATAERSVEPTEVLNLSRCRDEQAVRVSPRTTLIALLVLAVVAAAAIGGAP
jgi:hypothetical protein